MIRSTIFVATVACVILTGAQNQAQIVRTEQTSGTTALLIAVSAVNDSVVWVSGASGTWVRTVNGGSTWQTGQVSGADSLQFRDVHAVDANTAYLLSIGNGQQSRVYKTTDGGRQWTLMFMNLEPREFYDCMDFWDRDRGIVIGDEVDGQVRIFTTSDGGANFYHIPPETLPRALPGEGSFAASGTCLITRPGGHAWIVASNPERARLLHTTDYGRSWSVDTLPLTVRSGSGPQSVSFRDAMNGIVLAGGNSAQAGDVLAVGTRDGGKSWVPRTSPPLARGVWGGVYVPGSNPPAIVAVGPSGAVYSRDEGASWTAIDSENYWSVGFASPRAGWAVGARGRITRLSGF